jgi:predicted thioesterase
MKEIPVGTLGERRLLVTGEVAIDFLGSDSARVFATPWMIAHMEWTARDAIKPFLDEGWDSVGTLVNVRHLGATPIGMAVRFEAEVLKVDGNRVMFRVDAWDEQEKIGEGTHERFVVQIGKFATRLAAKVAKA